MSWTRAVKEKPSGKKGLGGLAARSRIGDRPPSMQQRVLLCPILGETLEGRIPTEGTPLEGRRAVAAAWPWARWLRLLAPIRPLAAGRWWMGGDIPYLTVGVRGLEERGRGGVRFFGSVPEFLWQFPVHGEKVPGPGSVPSVSIAPEPLEMLRHDEFSGYFQLEVT